MQYLRLFSSPEILALHLFGKRIGICATKCQPLCYYCDGGEEAVMDGKVWDLPHNEDFRHSLINFYAC